MSAKSRHLKFYVGDLSFSFCVVPRLIAVMFVYLHTPIPVCSSDFQQHVTIYYRIQPWQSEGLEISKIWDSLRI